MLINIKIIGSWDMDKILGFSKANKFKTLADYLEV